MGKGACVLALCCRTQEGGAPRSGVAGSYDVEVPAEFSYDLDELEALLLTLNINTLKRFVQRRDKPSSGHYFGRGKLEEVGFYAQQEGAGLVVVDGELSGLQMRGMEAITGCQVIDRAAVILEIFSRHASTRMARVQVQMARWKYMMPRMRGAWTHLSRQAGGGVRGRGMGEKQAEVDRRIARRKMSGLQKRLDRISVEKAEQGKQRKEHFKVALVGYTNSGKTTLMQALTCSSTPPKDQLFATLSAQVKSVSPARKHPQILYVDTVGFIRRLPHSLIASFRSTLEETLGADLALHIIDVAHPQFAAQMQTTQDVLAEIGAEGLAMIPVFNKTDEVDDPFLQKAMLKRYPNALWMSARCADDVEVLRNRVWEYFYRYFCSARVRVPTSEGWMHARIYHHAVVEDVDYGGDGYTEFAVRARPRSLKKLQQQLAGEGNGVAVIWNSSGGSHALEYM